VASESLSLDNINNSRHVVLIFAFSTLTVLVG